MNLHGLVGFSLGTEALLYQTWQLPQSATGLLRADKQITHWPLSPPLSLGHCDPELTKRPQYNGRKSTQFCWAFVRDNLGSLLAEIL